MSSKRRAQLSIINYKRTYPLREEYEGIKGRADQVLDKHLLDPDLIKFNDVEKSVTYYSEKLIPLANTNRPLVMLLFSNPHPHSIHQGMFLSPNTNRRENPFWSVMDAAGWLPISKGDRTPEKLVDICLMAEYQGPFELIFYCYYAFPTDFPEDISKIFGKEYFKQFIEPEAKDEFRKTVVDTGVEAIVTFNKGIFNLVAKEQIECYVERLMEGKLIQNQVKGINQTIPIFLTFPTGWHYHVEYKQFRKASLETIRSAIIPLVKGRKND